MHEEAVDLLRSALRWRLTTQGWREVNLAVRTLAGSADVERYLPLLELAAPKRIATRVPDESGEPVDPTTPIPDAVRERVNELIHRLHAEPEPDAEPPDGQS
ncbi:CATRA system-associated protein [Streptomyces mirabilis]|uniref:CATRA system-associated protein n=1 Tax=Streptomyces mirabilis TaxID=68239 RepID=UPI000F1A301B